MHIPELTSLKFREGINSLKKAYSKISKESCAEKRIDRSELIATIEEKRYVKRDEKGQFKGK